MTDRTGSLDPAGPLASTPPVFSHEAAGRILRVHYGVTASALTQLAGERDQNFRVEAADGQLFLLKVSNPADELSTVAMQTDALRHIERVDPGLPVMRTLPVRDGGFWITIAGPDGRDYPVRLFTFLAGQTRPTTDLTGAAIWSFGQVAARLGRALRGFFHPAADYDILWDVTKVPFLRPLLPHVSDHARRAQVERILSRFETHVAPVLPTLRAQVIHADLGLPNVLFGDDLTVTGILDFGDMTHAPLVCDLAVAVADVLHGRDDAIKAAATMIAGYVSVAPLEAEEAGLLADLVMARLAQEVTLSAWRLDMFPDNAAYAAVGEPGCCDFLDAIEAAGIDAVRQRFRHAGLGLPYRPVPTRELLQRRQRLMPRSPLFYADPVHLVRGDGVWLFEPDGRRYLDCYNNVPVVGHSHPRVARAVAAQQQLLATHSRYLHEAVVELAERLTTTLPPGLDSILMVNSGSEANDLAWRIARAATQRSGAVVTAWAYHGITEATHALSPEEWAAAEHPPRVATIPSPDGYRGRYRREEPGWAERYAMHTDDAAAELGDRGLAATYLEPAFTADGILAPPAAFLSEVARRTHALGGLVVADEVQAGYGRTGTGMWSFSAAGIAPDMVTMGKPMGNGFPVAALAVRSDVLAAVPAETELFSTFGGNPVACAAALAVLAVIEEEDLVTSAAMTGAYLERGLAALAAQHRLIGDIRGGGMMFGVELVADQDTRVPAADAARAVRERMREAGVLLGTTGPAGNVLKVRPPLVFGREHADLLLQTLHEALSQAER